LLPPAGPVGDMSALLPDRNDLSFSGILRHSTYWQQQPMQMQNMTAQHITNVPCPIPVSTNQWPNSFTNT
jgi:hypothetical protein